MSIVSQPPLFATEALGEERRDKQISSPIEQTSSLLSQVNPYGQPYPPLPYQYTDYHSPHGASWMSQKVSQAMVMANAAAAGVSYPYDVKDPPTHPRQVSPFRTNSLLNPPYDYQRVSTFTNPWVDPPKTISPKDALLDYGKTDEETEAPLFLE
jgi:hypothetical protein